jgi:uncharacterized protein with PIN domain
MKFLADRMLGRLSSWLRILGYDTLSANSFVGFSNAAEDTYMLKISDLERRTLLTRDAQLHMRAKQKYGIPTLLVDDGHVLHQLNQVRERFSLVFPEHPEAVRCNICNGMLHTASIVEVTKSQEIAKLRAKDVDIKKFIQKYDDYYKCDSCEKVFWKGQHWRNILDITRCHLNCRDPVPRRVK